MNDRYIIFIDPPRFKDFDIAPFVNKIEKKFDFINAYGIISNDVDNLKELSCVSAISIHTNVICTEIHTDNALNFIPKYNFSGVGATVAVIDSGIFNHLDFIMPGNRIRAFKDFVNQYDFAYDDNGHGTAVAGIIGGSGIANAKKFVGSASGCDLIILKAIKSNGEGSAFTILEAMQWIYDNKNKYNIQVVCMSFGAAPLEKNDPLVIGAEALWDSGITVVASAGNNGPDPETIRSPGCSNKIITVGGAEVEDNELRVPDFSSRGPVGSNYKPDIVALATDIICCNYKGGYTVMSGTSFSAPYVAGICAVIKAKYPSFTPDKIKEILLKNAIEFCGDRNVCGRGLINTDFLFGEL